MRPDDVEALRRAIADGTAPAPMVRSPIAASARDPNGWRGSKLLGFALGVVREQLRPA